MTTRGAEAGFTLIETMVALAILAMSAIAFLAATETHIARISGLETRAGAQWVAENHLAELSLGLPATSTAEMLGITYTITDVTTPTTDPDLQKIEIAASDATGGVTARLVGFLLTGGTP
jgi:general secretion pathway protein I